MLYISDWIDIVLGEISSIALCNTALRNEKHGAKRYGRLSRLGTRQSMPIWFGGCNLVVAGWGTGKVSTGLIVDGCQEGSKEERRRRIQARPR